jgi:broad specificity phosphatase PhoE
MMDDKKQIRSEAEEWYFRLLNDPNQFEKERYIDSINVYNSVIEEFQKLYEKTSAADLARDEIIDGIT